MGGAFEDPGGNQFQAGERRFEDGRGRSSLEYSREGGIAVDSNTHRIDDVVKRSDAKPR